MPPRKREPELPRTDAMNARPFRLPFIRRVQTETGGMHVTVRLARPKWQQWLGGPKEFDRTFSLDPLGREVYEACDGSRKVRRVIQEFAAAHQVSIAEAEQSVTAFLRTLLSKGLIAMEVDREKR